MNHNRSYIASVVGRFGRSTHSPNTFHWTVLERVLKYSKGTMNYGIHYICFPVALEGYNDANWIIDSQKTKSTSGHIFTLVGGVVS